MKTHKATDAKVNYDGCEVPSMVVAEFSPDDGWLEHLARLLILARASDSFSSGGHQLNQKKAH